MLGLNKNLEDISPKGSSLEDIAFELIKTAEAESWLDNLLYFARESNPNNSQLKHVVQQLQSVEQKDSKKQQGDFILPKSLTGEQSEQFAKVLIYAFPTKQKLSQMLMLGLNKNLEDISPKGSSLEDIAFELIKTAEAEGWLDNLLYFAREFNPNNSQLKHVVQQLQNPEQKTSFLRVKLLTETQIQKLVTALISAFVTKQALRICSN